MIPQQFRFHSNSWKISAGRGRLGWGYGRWGGGVGGGQSLKELKSEKSLYKGRGPVKQHPRGQLELGP